VAGVLLFEAVVDESAMCGITDVCRLELAVEAERRRLQAADLFEEGMRQSKVAAVLGVQEGDELRPAGVVHALREASSRQATHGAGIVIGGADGDFDKTEQAVVREACFSLDLPPHEVDL
jgi:hypothetical protein